MDIIKLDQIDYEDIANKLKSGQLGIFPFDTCYGLICDPTNQIAVNKLFAYKSRREGKAISVAVADIEMAENYVYLNSTAKQFVSNFLPGAFTLVLKSKHKFVKGIEAENGTVGIRIPDFAPIITLVQKFGSPLTSTSANQSYQKTPYSIVDILDSLSQKAEQNLDFIIDAGALPKKLPSTVIDLSNDEIHVIRKGSIIPQGAKYKEFSSPSVDDTIEFAEKLMHRMSSNLEYRCVIFALQGDMGAGKTHFTKGLANALGAFDEIISPTFVVSIEHDLAEGNKLFHLDTWRIENDNIGKIGFYNMLDKNPDVKLHNVIAIEWADKIENILNQLDKNIKIVWVEIVIDENDVNKRIIRYRE